ncbi:MAG: hypothetical protein ABSB59_11170 [Streptosporangiaceae bacterium]
MIAAYGQWPFPALRCHVLLIVLIVACGQFSFWQDPLGQDQLLAERGEKLSGSLTLVTSWLTLRRDRPNRSAMARWLSGCPAATDATYAARTSPPPT